MGILYRNYLELFALFTTYTETIYKIYRNYLQNIQKLFTKYAETIYKIYRNLPNIYKLPTKIHKITILQPDQDHD